jgi:hypothetical protein
MKPPIMAQLFHALQRLLPERIRRFLRLMRWHYRSARRGIGMLLGYHRPAVYAIGDSHAKYNFGAEPRIRVRYLGPVTMYRISRDGRKALSLKELGVVCGDALIWCLGAIDVSNHLIKQRDRQGVAVEEIVDRLARNYLRSVAEIGAEIGDLQMVILAVIPPTDQHLKFAIPSTGTLVERVNSRKLLNAALAKYSCERGFYFVDPFEPFEDSNGVLKPGMSDGNVHCGQKCAHLVVQKVLAEISSIVEK